MSTPGFYAWYEWRWGIGRYEGKTPADPKLRPKGLRRLIPLTWWIKAAKLQSQPKPTPPTKIVLPKLLQHPSVNFSERSAKVDLVVMHDTEGAYSSAINWLSNPRAQASAHIVLREDGKEATQLVRYSKKAWSCMAFNSRSLNLEMSGKASVGYGATEIDAAAAIVAYWCKLYGIPVRNAVGGTRSGITFHQDLGAAGGGHHDPGWSVTQKTLFIKRVQSIYNKGVSPTPYGRV